MYKLLATGLFCLAAGGAITYVVGGQIDQRRILEADELPLDLVPKSKALERTDLFSNHPFANQDDVDVRRRYRLQTAAVAKSAYEKLKAARDTNPEAISDKGLNGASLEWFKADVAASETRAAAMEAAAKYLEREGRGAAK
jgi:hypothetical protein